MQTVVVDRSRAWTVEDFLLLSETNAPCQLINGELVMSPAPSPNHQRVSRNIFRLLDNALKEFGELFYAPIDVYLDDKNVFQPDLLFVSTNHTNFITKKGIEGPPDLIVEILSSSNSHFDCNEKKQKYLEFGIGEYWIVDPRNKKIEVFTPQTGFQNPILSISGDGEFHSVILPDVRIRVSEIFNP